MALKRGVLGVVALVVVVVVVAVVILTGHKKTAPSAQVSCPHPTYLQGGTQPDGSVIIDPYSHEVFTPKALSAQQTPITAEQAYGRWATASRVHGTDLKSSGWEVRTGLLTFPVGNGTFHANNTPVYALWHRGGMSSTGGIPRAGCPAVLPPSAGRSWLFLQAATGAPLDMTSSQ